MTPNKPLRLIRRPEVLNLIGLSKNTLYSRIENQLMPPSINLGGKAVAFIEQEIQAVIAAMVEGKSPNEIRSLVISLVEQRQTNVGEK